MKPQIKSLEQLSVDQIDLLISQLEEGCDFLLKDIVDIKKYHGLSKIIEVLIDLRCKKLNIIL